MLLVVKAVGSASEVTVPLGGAENGLKSVQGLPGTHVGSERVPAPENVLEALSSNLENPWAPRDPFLQNDMESDKLRCGLLLTAQQDIQVVMEVMMQTRARASQQR